ncbi:MAG: tol-pal system protein YbgF [Deltaproteobacteria bacterium]|nr:tol-pal system protein YbgF [Deltaproteobacteria bacterium]
MPHRQPPPKRRTRGLAWVALCAAPATACSGARAQAVETEVAALRDELDELKRSQAAARVQYDEIKSRLVMVEERADSARVDRARRESGWIPKLPTVKVAPPAEAAPDVATAEPPPAPAPSGPSSDLPPQLDSDKPKADLAVALYTQAKNLLDAEQLTAARSLFEKLLLAHPDHDLADNAVYWVGESWYAQSQWLKAAQAFVRVAKDYPRGNKVPDAMYKLAKSYEKMGDDPGAGEVLKQLSRQYPGTPAARRALDDLQRKNAKGEL